jgi:hypothetical protein
LSAGSLVIDDVSFLPDDCFVNVRNPLNSIIKKHLEEGEEIPGAEIVRKMALRVS